MDYKEKIEKNPEKWSKWPMSKKEEVESDNYKYVKYGSTAWFKMEVQIYK